ncbi:hypothetical protein B0T24DRAFT_636612 [Lasiosphaeria ovina]|uniref:Uncharacterized protein n=1 Tax=Lasiosphaeria ovina TaxID=92902 RepID=A0AAE0N0I7_9PEZI|nr:hypothetical protein B0T24DRAFT_636612 [Lasiosphaeria ovina]
MLRSWASISNRLFNMDRTLFRTENRGSQQAWSLVYSRTPWRWSTRLSPTVAYASLPSLGAIPRIAPSDSCRLACRVQAECKEQGKAIARSQSKGWERSTRISPYCLAALGAGNSPKWAILQASRYVQLGFIGFAWAKRPLMPLSLYVIAYAFAIAIASLARARYCRKNVERSLSAARQKQALEIPVG